jgi:chromosomal replication initiation ATPase DnaA
MTPEQVIARAAIVFEVEPRAIAAGLRTARLVEARQAVAFVLKFQADQTYASIAEALGYADHSTAMWAVQAAGSRAKVNQDYSEKISQIGAMQ